MAFERCDTPGSWQLPQGGIDVGERPIEAAWRELSEETGLGPDDVELAGEHPHWTVYELPQSARRKQRLGQAHRWFFFTIKHPDVEPTPDLHEFSDWKWTTPAELIDEVVEFRKHPYRQVFAI